MYRSNDRCCGYHYKNNHVAEYADDDSRDCEEQTVLTDMPLFRVRIVVPNDEQYEPDNYAEERYQIQYVLQRSQRLLWLRWVRLLPIGLRTINWLWLRSVLWRSISRPAAVRADIVSSRYLAAASGTHSHFLVSQLLHPPSIPTQVLPDWNVAFVIIIFNT